VAAFDISSALMLSTCGTKGPVMTAKQTPWMHPCYNLTLTLTVALTLIPTLT